MDGLEAGHTTDVQRLQKVQGDEASGDGAVDGLIIVDDHGPVLAVAAQFDRVPLAQFQRFVRPDNGRSATHIKAEFRIAVVDAERNKVTASARLLTVVDDQTYHEQSQSNE